MKCIEWCAVLAFAITGLGCAADGPTAPAVGGDDRERAESSGGTTELPSADDGSIATGSPLAEDGSIAIRGETTAVGYTYHRSDGNRLVAGSGGMPTAKVLDIELEGVPSWVVAAAAGRGSIWMVALDDGRVLAFRIADGISVPVPLASATLPPGAPPVLAIEQDLRPRLANIVAGDSSELSHPVLLSDDRLVYISTAGELVLEDRGGRSQSLGVNALPDARILVDEAERLLLYNQPTTRYDHAVLGDGLEAGGAVLVETASGLQVVLQIDFEPVAEGIAPLWVDLDDDGRREIVVTLSDAERGAQIAVFTDDGLVLARGRALGQGYRWRHQVAIARFASDEVAEIAVVRTPHISGIVEFYRRRDAVLDIATQLDGYSSHLLGSRNLDMALAGDFDGDGDQELLLPMQDFARLGAVERTSFGARMVWEVDLGGSLSTNLAAVQQADGQMLVGAGHEGGVLRVWLP